MKTVNAFQFNASTATPAALRRTEMEIIEFANARFRSYYRRVAKAVLAHALDNGFSTIVELGAGCGPLTRIMAADERSGDLRFVVCDLIPNQEAFRELQQRYPERVVAICEPLDFSRRREWGRKTLLVLSAAFHHVPVENRQEAFKTLCASSGGVMIFATVRKTLWSMFCACFVLVPALLLPLGFWNRPGRLRRLLWCWLIPVAPLIMLWDGVGGCLRQWNRDDWQRAFDGAAPGRKLIVEETGHSQTVIC